MLESHYGVLYAGLVLVPLNTRLRAEELAYIIQHAGCGTILCDPSLRALAEDIVAAGAPTRVIASDASYELALSESTPQQIPVVNEWDLMALNYTSGTTGSPKGVMYHHRGAYLQALAMVYHFKLDSDAVYLWTLPMFHCNGWAFTWAVTAAGATHVCLPKVDPEQVWVLINTRGVTHLCAAPTVLVLLVDHPAAREPAGRTVTVATGGAPPTPTLLERCALLGFDVTHLYGLTETFGPIVICDWRSEWDELPGDGQARRKARQGVPNVLASQVDVLDGAGLKVPADGLTTGEIVLRGNNVMLGYYHDTAATSAAIIDGWLRTGDIAVRHPDGYLEIVDRAKDVIISGGENISSVEVERALASHPAVLESAVVAVADDKWGERPVAWVTLRDGYVVSAEELRLHVRQRLASFKVPDRVEFGALPRTASGKIRKAELRHWLQVDVTPRRADGDE
jgi:fatty-acyl-CoA synthase